MAEDWDLHAVVRSCKSTATSAAASTSEDPLSCLASLTFEEENNNLFSFPHLVEPRTNAFQELQEFCRPFYPTAAAAPTATISSSSHGIMPKSFLSNIGGSRGQHHHQHQRQRQQYHNIQQRQHPIRPNNISTSTTTSRFGAIQQDNQQRQHIQHPPPPLPPQQQQQQPHQQESQRPQTSSAMTLPTMQSQAPRSRKRKNQQKRTVCHVTAENLSADMWAWRKYGQKPIKGSPYPRNYYRCSSSKGCAARKQVERSNTDPNIFIITYTGDHTHPRPTHRNSLAGSTRNKFNKSIADKDSESLSLSTANASCSSPQSATSLSPTTPLPVQTDEENKITDGNDKENEEMMEEMDDEDEDEDDILIPNMAMNEDIFMGLQELGSHGGVGGFGQSPASGDNFSGSGRANSGRSSWGPCNSTAAT